MADSLIHDVIEIQNVISRYTNCINRRDWTQLESLFASDATWDVPGIEGMRFEGRSAIVAGIPQLVTATTTLVVLNTPAVIAIVGDTAQAESSIRETGSIEQERIRFESHGIYEDELARIDGQWRFTQRRFMKLENYRIPLEI